MEALRLRKRPVTSIFDPSTVLDRGHRRTDGGYIQRCHLKYASKANIMAAQEAIK